MQTSRASTRPVSTASTAKRGDGDDQSDDWHAHVVGQASDQPALSIEPTVVPAMKAISATPDKLADAPSTI